MGITLIKTLVGESEVKFDSITFDNENGSAEDNFNNCFSESI